MQTKSTAIRDDFPEELAELVKLMLQLSITNKTIEKVVSEAVSNEILYRFINMEITAQSKARIRKLAVDWSKMIYLKTGFKLEVERIEFGE